MNEARRVMSGQRKWFASGVSLLKLPSVLRMQSRSTVACRLAMFFDRLVRVRKLVVFDKYVTDAFDHPTVDPTLPWTIHQAEAVGLEPTTVFDRSCFQDSVLIRPGDFQE